VGNEWRGDDAVGLLVARRLQKDPRPQVEIAESRGTMTAVREAWKDAAGVIVVDAVVSGGPPGAIYRFDAHGAGAPVELSRSPSSHGWGVAEALALGLLFQDLPPFLIIYGIEGQNFGPGQEVSQEVAAAIPEAARRIRREIQAWLGGEAANPDA
jgi:hydrogenase maturation protease